LAQRQADSEALQPVGLAIADFDDWQSAILIVLKLLCQNG